MKTSEEAATMSNAEAIVLLQNGVLAAKADDRTKAQELLRKAVDQDPRNELAWLWLASVSTDTQEARRCLKKSLRINPSNPKTRGRLQRIEMAMRKTRRAVAPTKCALSASQPSHCDTDLLEERLDKLLSRLDRELKRQQEKIALEARPRLCETANSSEPKGPLISTGVIARPVIETRQVLMVQW